jgi:hypothetical protein
MSYERFEKRNQLYKELISKSPVGEFGSDYQKESLQRSMSRAPCTRKPDTFERTVPAATLHRPPISRCRRPHNTQFSH